MLPVEIIELILSFLPLCGKWRARQTCRLFRDLIDKRLSDSERMVEMRMVREWHSSVDEARKCCDECYRRQWVLDGLSAQRNKRMGDAPMCVFGNDPCTRYACMGNLKELRRAHEAGHPLSKYTLHYAFYHGSLDCLAYVWENGARTQPWEITWGFAIHYLWYEWSHSSPAETLACMIYLHERGVPFTHRECSSIHHQEGWFPGILRFIVLMRWCRGCKIDHDDMFAGGPWEREWLNIVTARGRRFLHVSKYLDRPLLTKLVFHPKCAHDRGKYYLCYEIPK